MTQQVLMRDLTGLCATMNKLMRRPANAWLPIGNEGVRVARVGHMTIDVARNGVALVEMAKPSGAQNVVLERTTRASLYHRMHALLQGYELAQRETTNWRNA